MITPVQKAAIYAVLGSSTSLIPLGIKDVSNSLGLTAGAYVTGDKVEGKDRFIDEFGTLGIWLLGVPFFKKVIDKTVYKVAGFNPNIDTRILHDDAIFLSAKDKAPEELKAGFEKIKNNKTLFKGMFIGKFIAATAMTMGAYSLLTITRHKHTEKNIIADFKKEEQTKKANQEFVAKKASFKAFKPSFGMNWAPLQQFMFDPVKNTMIIDGGITTERLADARNPQDFMGYVVKEGGFWAFMYFAGKEIQKHFEKNAAAQGRHIDLDIRVLQDEDFQAAIGKGDIQSEHLDKLPTTGSDLEIYNSLFKKENESNIVVKMAKKAGIITTIKDSADIDSQHFIDIKEIKEFKEKIARINTEFTTPKNGEKVEIGAFFDEILKLKRASVIKNIGACIGVLGLVVPGIMVAIRLMNKDNKEFAVKKEIHEKMKAGEKV